MKNQWTMFITVVDDSGNIVYLERLDETQLQIVQEASKTLRSIGSRAIVFVDAEPSIAQRARDAGAHGIEIYTGHYSAAFREGRPADCLAACAAAAEEAIKLGWAHGAVLTTFPGDTTMATLEQVKALAAGGSARIQR